MSNDRFATDVAKALEGRRPAPAREFEDRLFAVLARPPRRWLMPAVMAAAVAVCAAVLLVVGIGPKPEAEEVTPIIVLTPALAVPLAAPVAAPDAYQALLAGTEPAGLGLDDAQRARLHEIREQTSYKLGYLYGQHAAIAAEVKTSLDGQIVSTTKASELLDREMQSNAAIQQAQAEARTAVAAVLTDTQRAIVEGRGSTVPRKTEIDVGASATLRVKSDPPARVKLDGIAIGETPLEVRIGFGMHHLVLEHEGYLTHETDITTRDPGSAMEVNVALEAGKPPAMPESTGVLRVQSDPWSYAYIAGYAPVETPGKFVLPPGKYSVTLRNTELRKMVTKTVVIEAGKTSILAVNLDDDK